MNENEISRIAAATNAMRPDWPVASVHTLIATKLASHSRRDVAVALAWVACESDSKTPARVLESGPWWRAAGVEEAAATTTHTGKTVGRNADPREVCGICDMWRSDCEQRRGVSGHIYVPRIGLGLKVAEVPEVGPVLASVPPPVTYLEARRARPDDGQMPTDQADEGDSA